MTRASKTRKMTSFIKPCLLALALMAFMTGISWADPVTFDLVGVNDQSLMASVTFGYNQLSGTISIDITNLSQIPPNLDPRVTSFAFNAPEAVSGASSSLPLPAGWSIVFTPDDVNTPGNYGTFDIAGLTGPNFQGGSPNSGISVGDTFHFEITLTGSGLNGLDEMDFLSLLSAEENQNTSTEYFIARFQRTGPTGEGSDVGTPSGPPASVPEPATLLLLGVGLVGLAGLRRKKEI